MKQMLPGGKFHQLPKDIEATLRTSDKLVNIWSSLTPLARNEWICWVISVKQTKTRQEHLNRLALELAQGKRRPCCWIGCIHRTDKELSPSVKGILGHKTR